MTGTIRQQAGSYKNESSTWWDWPAGDFWRAGMTDDWHDSPAGWLLQ
jgi:hypothetical protein